MPALGLIPKGVVTADFAIPVGEEQADRNLAIRGWRGVNGGLETGMGKGADNRLPLIGNCPL